MFRLKSPEKQQLHSWRVSFADSAVYILIHVTTVAVYLIQSNLGFHQACCNTTRYKEHISTAPDRETQ